MSLSAKFWTLFAGAILVCVSSPASAANVFVLDITGTGARNFTDTTIWPSGILPTSADQAVIDQGDGINDYVYVDSPLTIQRFNIGNQNTGGLELRSGAYLFADQGGFQVNIGPSGAAETSLPGVGYLRIKSGATLEQTGLMYIGLNPLGTGTVTLEEGGTHLLGTNLGILDGIGAYNMLGGTLTVGNWLTVGLLGDGTGIATGNATFMQSGGTLEINRASETLAGMFIAFDWSTNPVGGNIGTYEISGGSMTVAASNQGVINGHPAGLGGASGTFRIVGSAPTVTIGTNYEQHQGSNFEVVIDAGGISPMIVGGDAILDGILGASFSTTPSVGQQFTIMNYTGSLTGTFASFDTLVDSPLGANTVGLSINYGLGTASSIVLTVDSIGSPVVPGDFDGDGDVDGADFVAWQTNFPTASGATLAQGDADGDGDVDGADFVVWQTNFPFTPGPGASPVPEPNAALLFAVSGIALAALRRFRGRA